MNTPPPKVHRYKVTCEVYENSVYKGDKDVFVEAVHCSVAAAKAELTPGYFAVDAVRV